MKITAKLYRVTTIRTAELLAAVGLDSDIQISPAELSMKVRQEYGPLAPRFQFWISESKTVCGIEAIAFDLQDVNVPMAGLVMVDPLISQDVDRTDGAIESELNRMNIGTDFFGYEWRIAYEVKGN
jgi:hypothetical protein